jgi:hypothetical protein
MIDAQGVYIAYQQARARYLNRPYKVPKDWDKVWAKLSEKSVYNNYLVKNWKINIISINRYRR